MDEIIQAAQRSPYTPGKMILGEGLYHDMNTRKTGQNNHIIFFAKSGGGKTRHGIKPNLLQANGSYLILDTKGLLYDEIGPCLESLGYKVEKVDFSQMDSTVGYNPLHFIREGEDGEQDILDMCDTICPVEDFRQPFWDKVAATHLSADTAGVIESQPEEKRTLREVCELANEMSGDLAKNLFEKLEQENPNSFAVAQYHKAKALVNATEAYASVVGIIGEKTASLTCSKALKLYNMQPQVDFSELGHVKTALFVTVSDVRFGLKRLTDLFVAQAFNGVIDEADRNCGGWLPVPVTFVLDDFANLNIPHFPELISVMRSRNVQCILSCQSISQLRERYGYDGAETILGNCSNQVVMSFVTPGMANYYAPMAGKTATTLLHTPLNMEWVFTEGKGRMVPRYELTEHPLYPQIKALDQRPAMGPAQRS